MSARWRPLLRLVHFVTGGARGRARDQLERRRFNLLTIMVSTSISVGVVSAIGYGLLDRALWPLSVLSLVSSVAMLVPLGLLRAGRQGLASHVLLFLMTLGVSIIAGWMVGREAGLHWFLWMVALSPVTLWPSRQALLIAYFLSNMVVFLLIEFALPTAPPLVYVGPQALVAIRAAALLMSAVFIASILMSQSWSADQHQRLLGARTTALTKSKRQLAESLAVIQTLKGIIPICMYCKSIRTDDGYWQRVEQYVQNHSQAEFSHGICPACEALHFPG